MAKKNKSGLLGIFQRFIGDPVTPPIKTELGVNRENSISVKERDKIITTIAEATQSPLKRRGTNPYENYIQPIARKIAASRLDAEAIEALAPEIKTAKKIVIPSIMSPSDMRDGQISIQSKSSLVTDIENEKISALLQEHFETEQRLSSRLPLWIHEALYGSGAQPLMVLPVTEIDTIITDPTAIQSKMTVRATENLSLSQQEVITNRTSIFGIADSAHTKKDIELNDYHPAVESIVTTAIGPIDVSTSEFTSYDLSKLSSTTVKGELKKFTESAIESINIADNPDVIKFDRTKKNKKTSELSTKILTFYKTATVITVNSETKPSIDNPIVYELPPESVIPIFTPGTPSDHIGYFIVLDEYGNPIHQPKDSSVVDMTSSRQLTPTSLYKSFGFDNHQLKIEQAELMMNIYQTIIESHLKNRLKNSGLDNIYIGAPSSIYRYMFSRYLSLRKTKLLFVPRDMMTYICVNHNHDGTGRSKIADIEFILSLKITILVCRVMSAMNNSINRRKLSINFVENMGDPIAFLEQVKKEAIDKSIMNFTYDPNEITRTLAQRAITLSVKGIPGAENYDITSEPNERHDIRPDDALLEDINNMLILSLDVPPSAFNMLSENEFSRSVATNNLFFCRCIAAYQKIFCELAARHVQIYTNMSEPLKNKIRAVISVKDKEGATEDADLIPADSRTQKSGRVDKSKSIDDKLADIINHITTVLPTPSIAPSKTEFEELDTIINSINTTLEAVFDNDLGSTDDNPMSMIRALVKEQVVRDYMTKIGVMRDVSVPDILDPKFLSLINDRKLGMLNIISGLKAAVKSTQPTTDVTTDINAPSPNTGGMPSSF